MREAGQNLGRNLFRSRQHILDENREMRLGLEQQDDGDNPAERDY